VQPAPANLLVPCQAMPALSEGVDMGGLLAADVELAGLYAECAVRHTGLIEWAEKAVK